MEDRFFSAIGVEALSVGLNVGYLYAFVSQSWDRFNAFVSLGDGQLQTVSDLETGLYRSCNTTTMEGTLKTNYKPIESKTCVMMPLDRPYKYLDISLPEDTVTPLVAILVPFCLVFSLLTTVAWSMCLYYTYKRILNKVGGIGFASVLTSTTACIFGTSSAATYIELKKDQRAVFMRRLVKHMHTTDELVAKNISRPAAQLPELDWDVGAAPIVVIVCSVLSFVYMLIVAILLYKHQTIRNAEKKRQEEIREAAERKAASRAQAVKVAPAPRDHNARSTMIHDMFSENQQRAYF